MKKEKKPVQKIRNVPESKTAHAPLTIKQLETNSRRRVAQISEEFRKGFAFIKSYPKSVTIFGSARFGEENQYYKKARRIAKKISREGFVVVTGGGPGVMEAANRGAGECGNDKPSIGICIRLPKEQLTNPYVTDGLDFKYFFSRKVILSFSAEAYIYFPGGFGTLDEFFEILTLVQTHKIEKVPIILVGSNFWKPLDGFIRKTLLEMLGTVNKDDIDLYTITDDEDLILDIVKKAPLRQE